ncbi:hypothetical protein F5X99DRAFT_404665 [Biscogniauxia marginata]|nr:hypothetical protein F5X99DRAFT_404665 [Biscogniauxia marginata]
MALLCTVRALILASIWVLWLESAVAGSIATWFTGDGAPQVIVQDDATGKIYYSLCNSDGTSVFPGTDSEVFAFDDSLAPKNGTSLAGVGYVSDGSAVAAMWYLKEGDQIVHALWSCDETGHFVPASTPNQWIVSSSVRSINPNTGLMALNLGEESGYQVYFHDDDMAIRYLRYSPSNPWSLQPSFVSQDHVQGVPIAGGFTDGDTISVIMPRDDSNIELSTLQSNGTWLITSFPTPFEDVATPDSNQTGTSPVTNATNSSSFSLDRNAQVDWSLEAWDGNAAGIGFALNDDASRNIFYIGNDSLLHHVNEVDGRWQAAARQDDTIWPTADEPNAQFASTFDFSRNEIWIYYMSGGNLTQVHRSARDSWQLATRLPNEPPATNQNGLSTGAQAGIGVGVGVAGLVLIGFAVFYFHRRRRGQKDKEKAEAETEAAATGNQQPPSSYPSPAPAYTSGVTEGQWIDGHFYPNQIQNKPEGQWQDHQYQAVTNSQIVYEMPNQEYTHEMANGVDYHEMPGNNDDHGATRRT